MKDQYISSYTVFNWHIGEAIRLTEVSAEMLEKNVADTLDFIGRHWQCGSLRDFAKDLKEISEEIQAFIPAMKKVQEGMKRAEPGGTDCHGQKPSQ